MPLLLRHGRLASLIEAVTLGAFLGMAGLTYFLLSGNGQSYTLLTPPIVALLLVANLLPAIALLMLVGRRVAKRRAAASALGSDGQLHVRLVAIFSTIASVPMLLVVIFASLLFQYGVQFWFSDSARSMLQNASDLARGYYEQNLREVGDETVTMSGDLRKELGDWKVNSPHFAEYLLYQVVSRKLSRAAIIELGNDGIARTAATVDPENRPAADKLTPEIVNRLSHGETIVVETRNDQIDAVMQLYPGSKIYLYASRNADSSSFSNVARAQKVLADYDQFAARSRALQLRFNIALFVGSLLLVGIAVYIALAVADWMVRPVNELVTAARRITAGDLSARVTHPQSRDEIGTLAAAFNRMTQRLEAQTGALVAANSQLDERRAFIEAILSGVSAGVLSIDRHGVVLLLNSSAAAILVDENDADPVGRSLADVAPELAELIDSDDSSAIVQVRAHGDLRTLAVKVAQDASSTILTFDDITQQLSDQRRAAWSDVARRIAHEIKNPLTPIQLAAERLQRRYADEVTSDRSTFTRLTGTIVRQVGDLRRIVDEFSSFARMPKPVFRREAIGDIARHALFLHEVAHPDIAFAYHGGSDELELVCDRRQLGQALTNIVKNAVEAIEPKGAAEGDGPRGHVTMTLAQDGGDVVITVRDDGVGLPPERERILEPYMTTRAKGTGLGLAIVKKIVEEHMGEIRFDDAEGGGARVTLRFAAAALDKMEEGRVVALPQNKTHGKVTANGA